MEVGEASLVVSSEENTTALNEFETVDLKKNVQVLGRVRYNKVTWEATKDFSKVDAVLASVVKLASSFHSFSEVVMDINKVQYEEERSSEVRDKRGGLELNDQPSVFKQSI